MRSNYKSRMGFATIISGILLFVLINGVIIVLKRSSTLCSSELDRYKTVYQDFSDFFTLSNQLRFRFEGTSIKNLKLLNLTSDTISFSDLITRKSLVLVYSEFNCGVCVDKVIDQLRLYAKNDFEQILILTSNSDYKNLVFFKKFNSISQHVFNITDTTFLHSVNSPFLFIVYPDNVIKHVFVPEKDFPEATKLFVQFYFKGDNDIKIPE